MTQLNPTANDNLSPRIADAVCSRCATRIEQRDGSIYTTTGDAWCGPRCAAADGMQPWREASLVERMAWPA